VEKQEPLGMSDKIKIAIQASMFLAKTALMNQTTNDLTHAERAKLLFVKSPSERTEVMTANRCNKATFHTICDLFSSYPDLFDTMIVIRAENNSQKQLPNGWKNHQYFLVQDVLGTWHAGSPANYEQELGRPNRLTQVFSGDLGSVLLGIERFEGGIWPTKDIIEKEVKPLRLKKPVLTESGLLGLIVFRNEHIESIRKIDFKSGKVFNWPIPAIG
jgi:hypothetical protein